MRRMIFVLAALFATAALAAPAALAGNGHFIANATGVSLNGANLVCSFKEAGLESGSVETISCAGNEVVTYECVNGGGRNPSASNKTSVTGPFNKSGNFTAAKNGNVVGSLTVTPLSASDVGFTCPNGQKVTFVSVCYSDVTITDSTSGAMAGPFPGPFCFTNPNAP